MVFNSATEVGNQVVEFRTVVTKELHIMEAAIQVIVEERCIGVAAKVHRMEQAVARDIVVKHHTETAAEVHHMVRVITQATVGERHTKVVVKVHRMEQDFVQVNAVEHHTEAAAEVRDKG